MDNEETEKESSEASQAGHLSPTMTAVFIGVLIGIVIYSVTAGSWGLLTLIPLYLAYKLIKSK